MQSPYRYNEPKRTQMNSNDPKIQSPSKAKTKRKSKKYKADLLSLQIKPSVWINLRLSIKIIEMKNT